MKKTAIVLTAAIFLFLFSCDLITPPSLDQLFFDNPVDPGSDSYTGLASEDSDGDGIGDYRDPDEIIQLLPEDGAELKSPSFDLTVKPKAADVAASYGFEVSESPDMSSPIITESDLTEPGFTVPAGALTNHKTFYWRSLITAKNGKEHKGRVRSFRIEVDVPVPTGLSPAADSLTLVPPLLGWDDTQGVEKYQVQIADSAAFDNIIYVGETTISELPDAVLKKDSANFWRVRAFISPYYSAWSEVSTINEVSGRLEDRSRIAAGFDHAILIRADKTVRACGYNFSGQLGFGAEAANRYTSPQSIPGLMSVVDVSAGDGFSASLLADGAVKSWGANYYGQLGIGRTGGEESSPVDVSGLTDIVRIEAGNRHMLALSSDGSVWSWGYNGVGQLGNGTYDDSNLPVRVVTEDGTPLKNIVNISTFINHSMALTLDGRVYAWGENHYGELGTDPAIAEKRNFAAPVEGLPPAAGFSLGGSTCMPYSEPCSGFSLALTEGGDVYSWGINNGNQLGDGTTLTRHAPTMIELTAEIVKIFSGRFFSFAIDFSGEVWVWGSNWTGCLGTGVKRLEPSPVLNPNLSDIVCIESNEEAAFFYDRNGRLYGCGGNDYGQLGDGTTSERLTPIELTSYW